MLENPDEEGIGSFEDPGTARSGTGPELFLKDSETAVVRGETLVWSSTDLGEDLGDVRDTPDVPSSLVEPALRGELRPLGAPISLGLEEEAEEGDH